jgi:hypothetical protein
MSTLQSNMNRIQLHWLAAAVALLLAGCSDERQDVTYDLMYGKFGAIKGVWKTKVPMRLVQAQHDMNIAGGDTFLVTADRVNLRNDKVLTEVPAGTEIRIERLIYVPSWECSLLGVTGSLTAGPYKDQQAQLDSGLFAKDLVATIEYTHGDATAVATTWTVDPKMLEKLTPGTSVRRDTPQIQHSFAQNYREKIRFTAARLLMRRSCRIAARGNTVCRNSRTACVFEGFLVSMMKVSYEAPQYLAASSAPFHRCVNMFWAMRLRRNPCKPTLPFGMFTAGVRIIRLPTFQQAP